MPSNFGRAPVLAILALCGSVSPALAQSDTGFLFDAPATLSPAQPSITVRLFAEFPAADWAFARSHLDLLASEPGWTDPRTVRPGGSGPVTTPGVITGSDVLGVFVGQYQSPTAGIYADPTNPIEVWAAEFTITDFTPRTISISTDALDFSVYPIMGTLLPVARAAHEATHEIRVIPAPGALAMGGVVGLCAMRRRQRGPSLPFPRRRRRKCRAPARRRG